MIVEILLIQVLIYYCTKRFCFNSYDLLNNSVSIRLVDEIDYNCKKSEILKIY